MAVVGRGPALTAELWTSMHDDSGRVVNESGLRQTIFRGGIEPELRQKLWPYLLGMFPFQSTTREREVLQREARGEYAALKARWKEVLEPETASTEDEWTLPPGEDDQYMFVFIQAKVAAMRHTIDETSAATSLKSIRKDVPRTDRANEYYRGDDNVHLQWLHDILATYAVFHPTVGYAQGMNDILAMILCVLDHEADAYCAFSRYMDGIQRDFMAEGMMHKLDLLRELLRYMDPELHAHFVAVDAGELVFCHRWLLLSFRREFPLADALRIFEILCSHHLEVSSLAAETARLEERRRHTAETKGAAPPVTGAVAGALVDGRQYTFELFVCMAILETYRASFLEAADVAGLFMFSNGLVGTMDLAALLARAEAIFLEFCRKSALQTTPLAAAV